MRDTTLPALSGEWRDTYWGAGVLVETAVREHERNCSRLAMRVEFSEDLQLQYEL